MRFRRTLSTKTDVNLVPMIDIVFQLVIYFMVSTTIIVTPGIPLVFPESVSADPVAMTKLVVTVVTPEELYLNQTRYNLSGLRQAFASMAEDEQAKVSTVVIEGDSRADYPLMINVLDILRDYGFKGVNLKTRQSNENLPAVTE